MTLGTVWDPQRRSWKLKLRVRAEVRRTASAGCSIARRSRTVEECAVPGARGRDRTGTTFLESRDFLTTSAFAASTLRCRSWSGARLRHSLSLRRPPSALYTFPASRAWLGVSARGTCRCRRRAFAEFDGLHLGGFPSRAQIVQVPCVYQFHHSGKPRSRPPQRSARGKPPTEVKNCSKKPYGLLAHALYPLVRKRYAMADIVVGLLSRQRNIEL